MRKYSAGDEACRLRCRSKKPLRKLVELTKIPFRLLLDWIIVKRIKMKEMQADLKNRVAIVTGGTGGIGREAARSLAAAGAEVVLVGRNRQRTESAVNEIKTITGNQKVDFLIGDLSSRSDVSRVAEEFLATKRPLNILLNNAGAIFPSYRESVDGIEMTWALNHLAYFQLTNLLLDRLKESRPARIVSVASAAHYGVKGINWDNPEFRGNYSAYKAYGQSKLANILFTRELARRLRGTGVTANSLHPGFVATSFGHASRLYNAVMVFARPFQRSVEKGAKTSIYLCTSPEVETVSGEYFVDSRIAECSQYARDDEAARRLWEISEKMVGVGQLA